MASDLAVPESRETLAIQRQELQDGKRHVMVYKGGLGPRPPQGMRSTRVGRDEYHFNPKVHSPYSIHKAVSNDTIGQHLRLGKTTKNEALASGEPMHVVVERTPQGHEVRGAVGTKSTRRQQFDHFDRTKTKGNVISLEHPAHVLGKRMA